MIVALSNRGKADLILAPKPMIKGSSAKHHDNEKWSGAQGKTFDPKDTSGLSFGEPVGRWLGYTESQGSDCQIITEWFGHSFGRVLSSNITHWETSYGFLNKEMSFHRSKHKRWWASTSLGYRMLLYLHVCGLAWIYLHIFMLNQ